MAETFRSSRHGTLSRGGGLAPALAFRTSTGTGPYREAAR